MTIAFDASSHLGTGGATFRGSWTHTPAGTPKGVFVMIGYNDAPDRVTGVTYGGVALARVAYYERASGGQSVSQIWFLGSGIPTGAQTVVVSGPGDNVGASTCVTMTANGNTAVNAVDGGSGSGTDLFASLATGGKVCFSVASLQPEGSPGSTAATTGLYIEDWAGKYLHSRQTTPSASPEAVGCTQGAADYSFAVANAYDTLETVGVGMQVI